MNATRAGQAAYLARCYAESSADCLAANRAIDGAAGLTPGQLAGAAYAASISPYVTTGASRELAALAARAYTMSQETQS